MLIPASTAGGLSTKTQGKLSLIFLLVGIGVVTKYLIHLDQKAVDERHDKPCPEQSRRISQPDRIIEYQKGFNHWRIEWYDGKQYKFRNGVLLRGSLTTK